MNAEPEELFDEPAPPAEEIPAEAYEDEPHATEGPIALEDFYAYMPAHSYIYTPTREPWPAPSVNARIPPIDIGAKKPISASEWLDRVRPVEQMTWCPGMPMVIENRLVADGGWIERPGCHTFNLYRPPLQVEGDPAEAGPWLAHVHRVFPAEAEHIVKWLAHRVQHPGEKLNHALVLGGDEGIGKDSILEPVKHGVGSWNFAEVSPQQLLGRFNSFVKCVILRMSEARDLGDIDRYALAEHLKPYIAAPPDVLRCDEKNLREHSVFNLMGVVITTNHEDGLHIPADSRRYFVAWSELTKESYDPKYWRDLYRWYHAEGGIGHVAAYLRTLDLSAFDPKAPPPKTPAFMAMVAAGRAPEDAELADAIDALGNPAAVTVAMLCIYASETFREWLQDRRNSRQVPHRMKAAGYTAVSNDAAQSGLWVVLGKRQVIYARRELQIRDRIAAASRLCREGRA
ncbi:MAG: primase-helicase family protein [Steroidobacteraceae bacterium]